jgi:hypothetical protein
MKQTNNKTTETSGRPVNYFGRVAMLLLIIPVFAMLYVSVALFISPIQANAVIFVALPAAPLFIQVEWYAATLIGLYAVFSIVKSRHSGLIATILLALAYVHLHTLLLGNISIPASLTILAAVSALIGVLIKRRRNGD